ncbi:MAG TPA: tetratricopeptide repeat protein [Bacteroidales bacterium]|jgi:tetratricopeptide (TPR) repeat protein|nr:tetratricopeptide repeat protein [Bacteroidales bacterium]HOS58254.1 tetratricopeptide repeat protein [Bacteroidales bacterium]HRT13742.1 tetratricopeptide repeat protein [Bacteroidales bacterium]HXK74230.1 tetratricopeptide repeat protein [Bacteroidales bacterium]
MKKSKLLIVLFLCFSFFMLKGQEYNSSFSAIERNSDSITARQGAEVKLMEKFTNSLYDELTYHKFFKDSNIKLPQDKEKVKEIIRNELSIMVREDWNKKRCVLKGEVHLDLAEFAKKVETLFNTPNTGQGGGRAKIQAAPPQSLTDILFAETKAGYLTEDEIQEAENYFIKALELQELGLNELAIEHYYKGISINATAPEPIFNMGNAYYAIDKFDDAIKCYQKVISMKKDFPSVYLNMGNAYLDKKEYSQAISAYQTALEHTPNNAAIYNNLGIIYLEQKNQQEAITAFKRAAQLGSIEAQSFLSANGITW